MKQHRNKLVSLWPIFYYGDVLTRTLQEEEQSRY